MSEVPTHHSATIVSNIGWLTQINGKEDKKKNEKPLIQEICCKKRKKTREFN